MRTIEFNMERPGLLEEGEEVEISEGKLPSSYYYTIEPSLAMSKNFRSYERLKSRKGVVTEITQTLKGYHVMVDFEE